MITIFTATYNRGYIIKNLYESLKRQTCQEFEWIVIDDGSTDNTEELFNCWMQEKNNFSIRYQKVKNGGKHRAINIGVKIADTEAFFIVDSDDYLTNRAVETVSRWFEEICDDSRYAGISGLRGKKENLPIGGWGNFYSDFVETTNLEREREKYGLLADQAEVYKTSLLRKYPFPEFEGENFLSEGIIWDKMALDGYILRWYNEIIYISDYREDGLTKRGYRKYIENPKGYMAYMALQAEIYGKEYYDKHKFGFYFVLRSENNMQESMNIMEIPVNEMQIFENKYRQMTDGMNQFFSEHSIKTAALYGLGNVGTAFVSVSSLLNISIKYGIDKNLRRHNKIRVCTLDEDLEKVDAVIVTLKDYNTDVEKSLKGIFKKVIYWKDISGDYWMN